MLATTTVGYGIGSSMSSPFSSSCFMFSLIYEVWRGSIRSHRSAIPDFRTLQQRGVGTSNRLGFAVLFTAGNITGAFGIFFQQ